MSGQQNTEPAAVLATVGTKYTEPAAELATVGTKYTDGLSLIFDGQTQETAKHYKCNTDITFQAGDRVKICRISGTYVVEYVVGNPK